MILHEKIPMHYLQTKNKCANAIEYGNLRVMSLLAFGFRRVCNYEAISNNLPPSPPFFNGFNKISKTCRILCLSEWRAFFWLFQDYDCLKRSKRRKRSFPRWSRSRRICGCFTEVARFTDKKELAPATVNKLLQRIEAHNPEKALPQNR